MIFKPIDKFISANILGLNLKNSTSSQKIKSHRHPLKFSKIPDPRYGQSKRSIQAITSPIPEHIKWVQYIIKNSEWDE